MKRFMRSLTLTTVSTNKKESGFLVSLMVWGLCAGIRTKVLWVVGCTWAKLVWSFALHGIAGTLPNESAWYFFAVLIVLTGTLYKALMLQRDARKRTIKLARASVDLGIA